MTRSPLGQLTNLLACINNELTHKTTKKGNKEQTDRNVTETKTRSPLIYVNLNRRKRTVGRWGRSRRYARLSLGHLVALLYGLPSSVLPFRTPTHTHMSEWI